MRALALTLVVILVSGCAGNPPPPKQDQAKGSVQDRLTVAAEKAADAVKALALIEQTKAVALGAARLADTPVSAPDELAQEMTVGWVGPLEPFVRMLADKAGYGFQALGAKPAVPVVVTIDPQRRRLVDILQDVGLQAGRRADVVVRFEADGRGIVEVRYAQP